MTVNWHLNDLVNYIQTWSAVKRFITEKKFDPLSLVMEDLERWWGKHDKRKVVKWDINLRVGKIQI